MPAVAEVRCGRRGDRDRRSTFCVVEIGSQLDRIVAHPDREIGRAVGEPGPGVTQGHGRVAEAPVHDLLTGHKPMLDVDRAVDGVDLLLVERRGGALRRQREAVAGRQGARQRHRGARRGVGEVGGELEDPVVHPNHVIDRVVGQAGDAGAGGEVVHHRLAGLERVRQALAGDGPVGRVDRRVGTGECFARADHGQHVPVRVGARGAGRPG